MKLTCLVVDDRNDMLMMAAETLKHVGFEVSTASSEVEATQMIGSQRKPFSFVLTDKDMIEINGGLDVIKVAREKSDDTVIWLYTGRIDDVEAIKKAFENGANRVLEKPFSLMTECGALLKQCMASTQEIPAVMV